MHRADKPLTEAEKAEVFHMATRALPERHKKQIRAGMSDAELTSALEAVPGIWGGSCGPGRLNVIHQAVGLRIWGGRHIINRFTEPPLFKGAQTLAMVRLQYNIPDPDDPQLPLF